jgi:hypothetical protein
VRVDGVDLADDGQKVAGGGEATVPIGDGDARTSETLEHPARHMTNRDVGRLRSVRRRCGLSRTSRKGSAEMLVKPAQTPHPPERRALTP